MTSTPLPPGLFDPAAYAFNWQAVPYFAAVLAMFATAGTLAAWERASRTSLLFLAYSGLFAAYAAAHGFLRLLVVPELAPIYGRMHAVLIALALPVLFQFALIVLHREAELRRWVLANWGTGLVFAAIGWNTDWLVTGVARFTWGFQPGFGALGWALLAWVVAQTAGVWRLFFQALLAAPKSGSGRDKLVRFGTAVLALNIAGIDLLNALGLPIYPIGSFAILAFAVMIAHVAWQYGLSESTPQFAARQIADMIRGALLILDREGVVRYVNRWVPTVFGRLELVGHEARQALGETFSPESLSALARSQEQGGGEKEIVHTEAGGKKTRDLSLSATAVRDHRDREVAYVCLARDITEAKRREQEKLVESRLDALTGLPNRTLFLGYLDAAVQRARESKDYAYAVCFLGLDRIRILNEELGFAAGDYVLAEIARRLKTSVRPQDSVARVGGDEFGVLLRGYFGSGDLRKLVERLDQVLREPLVYRGQTLYASISVGVASSGVPYADGGDLLRKAGIGMYRAKQKGGGTHFYNAPESGTSRTKLEAELRSALQSEQFVVHYQPMVDLVERRIVSFEALVRWQHPERGLLLPGEFIEVSEEIGLMSEVDRYVCRRACADLKRLHAAVGDTRLSVSVNLTENVLLGGDVVELLAGVLRDEQLPAANLHVELLERVTLAGELRETLRRLRQLGVGLYVDDFGTGYSALSRLHEMPITALKVDREFVRSMSSGDGGRKIIASILAMAAQMDLLAIAEGADTVEEVQGLHQIGCRYVQGFYFSKAVSFDEILALLQNPEWLTEKLAPLGS